MVRSSLGAAGFLLVAVSDLVRGGGGCAVDELKEKEDEEKEEEYNEDEDDTRVASVLSHWICGSALSTLSAFSVLVA